LSVSLEEDTVDQGGIEPPRTNASKISEADIFEADANFIAVQHVQTGALWNIDPENQVAAELGKLTIDLDFVALHFVDAGSEIEVKLIENILAENRILVAAHELKDIDRALMHSVEAFIQHKEYLFKRNLRIFNQIDLMPLLFIAQVVRKILGTVVDFS
jgi:hypothetical protein